MKTKNIEDFEKDFEKASNDKHDIEFAQDHVISTYKWKHPYLKLEIDKYLQQYKEDFEKQFSK